MKLIETIADAGHVDTVRSIAEAHDVLDFRLGFKDEDGRQVMRMLVRDEKAQSILDALQGVLGKSEHARIIMFPVEATLPRPEEKDESEREKRSIAATRESLYDSIAKNARWDTNFMILVMLSTVVAAIGLIEDNVAVVIGAMVIAPLLGPNLALALGTALGDGPLMWQAIRTNLGGLGLTLLLSLLIGVLWPVSVESGELMARTEVGLDSVALALASGAAAVLSITTGLPSVLVGVMVAVALMPPAATVGLMLGSGQPYLAGGAALLLAINIVSVNLSAKMVFLIKGVRPRTWLERRKAKQSMTAYLLIWAISLAALVAAILFRP